MANYRRKIKRQNLVIAAITVSVYFGKLFCGLWSSSGKQVEDAPKFAGSAACASCHNQVYQSHIQTAHYLDSRPATKESIKGSFEPGKNKFVYNKFMEVVLQEEQNRFYQVSLIKNMEIQREAFDIVIGSGRKGQTYLFWKEDDLYQLPVSYYSPLQSWCNSPGFPVNYVRFNRPIPAQCLECHATFADNDSTAGKVNRYDKASIIYGIDCERCHGPGSDHVTYHQEHPGEKSGRYIINTKQMDRQLRVDACALCHSGFRDPIKPAFSFQAGQKLDEFSKVRYSTDTAFALDVHGNQYGLLGSSKCYKQSLQMDCSSCHNPHANEFNDVKLFSARCMSCHAENSASSCKLKTPTGMLLADNCVDCHMPVMSSAAIRLNVANADQMVPDPVRTHRIAIYPAQTKVFIDHFKLQKN